jgi:hypothetical protein
VRTKSRASASRCESGKDRRTAWSEMRKRPIARSRACASGVCGRSVCCPQVGSARAATRRWPESGRPPPPESGRPPPPESGRHHAPHPTPPRTASSTSTSRSRSRTRVSSSAALQAARSTAFAKIAALTRRQRVEVDLKEAHVVRPPPAPMGISDNKRDQRWSWPSPCESSTWPASRLARRRLCWRARQCAANS